MSPVWAHALLVFALGLCCATDSPGLSPPAPRLPSGALPPVTSASPRGHNSTGSVDKITSAWDKRCQGGNGAPVKDSSDLRGPPAKT